MKYFLERYRYFCFVVYVYLVNTGFRRSSDTRSADDLYFWLSCMLPVMQMGELEAERWPCSRGWLL